MHRATTIARGVASFVLAKLSMSEDKCVEFGTMSEYHLHVHVYTIDLNVVGTGV